MPKCKIRPICLWNIFGTCFIFAIFFLISLSEARSKLTTEYQSILCADKNCQEPISEGVTTTKYPAPEKILLSFKKDLNVRIFGKTGDKNFYFVEANQRRGFVPAKLVKETKVLLDETKLNDVIFDFAGFEKTLDSSDEKNESSIETPTVLSPSEQIPNDNQSGTATPFVYTQKLTVIDGTTIDEDLLVVTATPSPTFVENAVTKTATIEANFTGEELDRETVAQQESELGKERGSLFKLVKGVPANPDVPLADGSSGQAPPVSNNDPGDQPLKPIENTPPVVPIKTDNNVSVDSEVANNTASQAEVEESITIDSLEDTDEDISADDVIDVSEDNIVESKLPENDTETINKETKSSETLEQKKENVSNIVAQDTVENVLDKASEEMLSHKVDVDNRPIDADEAAANVEQQQNEKTENVAQKEKTVAKGNDDLSKSPTSDDNGITANAVHNFPDPVDGVTAAAAAANKPSPIITPIHQTNSLPPTHHIHRREADNPVVPPARSPQTFSENPNPNVPPIPNTIPESAVPKDDRPIIHHHPNRRPLPPHLNSAQTIPPNPSVKDHSQQHYQYSDQKHQETQYPNQHPGINPKILPKAVDSNQPLPDANLNKQNQQFSQPITVTETPSPPVKADIPNPGAHPTPPPVKMEENPNHSSPVNVSPFGQAGTNSNIAKRKLLAERVEFVSVIMDIIPDEVELFFESFNILLHAIIVTSIIGFFWCLSKVFISFVCSSKKVRELRDVICQIQRKLYYLEAERDKLKEEHINCGDEYSTFKHDLSKVEKRKFQLEQENEKLKHEILALKKKNLDLSESNKKLDEDLDLSSRQCKEFSEQKREMSLKIDKLEPEIQKHLEAIANFEKNAKSDKEEIDNLNKQLISLNEDNEKLNEELDEMKMDFETVKLDYKNLKELQNERNEEIKHLKDELLCSQEKAEKLEKECKSLESQLISANEKISALSKELETKNAEIMSMQSLLTKLNKNMNQENIRPKRSIELMQQNGDLDDGLNGNDSEMVSTSDDSEDLQNVVQLQLRLTQLEYEKDQYKSKYEALQKQIEEMNVEVENIKKINEQLKEETKAAIEDKNKAVVELEVLTRYYKEKELEYAKDIGVHKVKQEQQSEDVTSLTSKLEVIQEENGILKEQLKSTKKELEETERRFKSQLNQLEKQSHENWIAARNAERKFEEANAEASALRQTLTKSVKSPPPGDISFGYLDISSVSAGSVGSIPEMLNNSVPVPPPPPPPPPFLGMFGIPPPPMPAMPPGPAIFDHNQSGSNNVNNTLWTAPAPVPSSNVPQSESIPPPAYDSLRNNMAPINHNQTDSTYSQVNQSGAAMMHQPYNNSYNQMSNQTQQPSNLQYNSNPYHQYGSSHHDLSRNTYSPMSQRSTTTPLTSLPAMMQQQANPAYSVASSHVSQYPSNMAGSQPNNNSYSIQGTDYSAQNYPQQPHQNAYSIHNQALAQTSSSSQHQFYNQQGQQHQQQQQHPVIDQNVSAAYYGHQQASHQMAPQQPSQDAVKKESDSRPVSVHSQMV